jgi:hypothetical protein
VRWFALLVLALPLTACGGVSINAVANAATKATTSGSEHVVIEGTVSAAGQAVSMNGTGDFQSSPKLGSMQLSLGVAGKQISMNEVQKGTTVYMRSSVFSSNLPAGKTWVSVDLASAANKLGVNLAQYTQQDPTDILAALRKAGSVDKIGSETVAGVGTTHYRATIDLEKTPNGKQLEKVTNLKALPVDVWIDGNNLLRRMTMKYSAGTASTTMQMDLSNYGEQVNVQVPSTSETVDMTKLGG